MTEQEMQQREAISALTDGQLAGEELAQTLDLLRSENAAVEAWHDYHLVGEVLRGGALRDCHRDTAFLQRLRVNLEQEVVTAAVCQADVPSFDRPSANDAHGSWRWVAGLAVMAVAGTVGWMSMPGPRQAVDAPALAQLPAPAPSLGYVVAGGQLEASGRQQTMIRDPKLDQWLAAHRQFGGASALQMPAGFVRNATFEGAAR